MHSRHIREILKHEISLKETRRFDKNGEETVGEVTGI